VNLRQIFLGRTPGIRDSFTLDGLSPEINIIVGPNGSGKSSLCRAIAATLWPSQDTSTRLEVETVWDEAGRILNAERLGGRVSWKSDGTPVGTPSLPEAHLASCYQLGVRDLMQEDNAADKDIAQHIRIQMAGGYDIQKVLDRSFSVKRKLGDKETREIGRLRRSVGEICSRFGELAVDQDRLVELEERQKEAKDAEQEHRVLDSAVELAELRAVVEGLDASLNSYSSHLDALTGDEIERIDAFETELKGCNSKIENDSIEVREAESKIKDAHLDDQRPDQTELNEWAGHLRSLREHEHELSLARQSKKQRDAELEHALVNLGGDPAIGVALDLSNKALDEVDAFVKQRDKLTGRGSVLRAQVELLGSHEKTDDRDSIIRGAELLRNWLSASQGGAVKIHVGFYIASAIGVVVGIALAYLYDVSWLALSAFGGGIAFMAIFSSNKKQGGADEGQLYAEQYNQCDLDEPDDWSRGSVTKLLHAIEQRLAYASLADEKEAQLAPIKLELKRLERKEYIHEETRVRLQKELGVDIASDLTLAELMYRYQAYRIASEAVVGANALVTNISENCSGISEDACSFLPAYGYEPKKDSAGLEAQLTDLKERLNSYNIGIESRERAETRVGNEDGQRRNIQGRISKFYTDRGLDDGERDALTRMLDELPSYRELMRDRDQRTRRILQLEHKLKDRPNLLGLTKDQAERLSDEARRNAGNLGDIANEIGRIEGRVKDAREGNALEVAEADLKDARDDLVILCERAQFQAAGRFLLQDVDTEHERLSRPPVMEHAAEYFRTFTGNSYELRLPDVDDPEFSAWDTSAAKSVTLSELSDGTRIQLLLAVRIAFAIEAEQGTKVPLMLDEALSTADPERFRAVAESLVILAKEGRQIFYMTANPADVTAWEAVCGGSGVSGLNIIALAEVRGVQAAVSDKAMLHVAPPPEVPKPGAMTEEQYGIAIGVPPANASEAVESLHLFYLLRNELDSLHTLLEEARISTVGQWKSLSESGQSNHFLANDVCIRLDAIYRCAWEIYELRSVGRGKLIDGEVLRESEAVSDRFIERLTSLASDLEGDANRFLAAFDDRSEERVKGFRNDAQLRLRAYLEDNGFIDSRPVVGDNEIRLHVIEQTKNAINAGVMTREDCGRFVDQLLSVLDKTSN